MSAGDADLAAPLRGRRALVTGAGGGIGLACARSLAERGAELVLLGRASVEKGADLLRSEGHTVSTVSCDLSEVDDAFRCGEELADRETIDRSGATSTAKPSGWSTDPSSSSASRKGCT